MSSPKVSSSSAMRVDLFLFLFMATVYHDFKFVSRRKRFYLLVLDTELLIWYTPYMTGVDESQALVPTICGAKKRGSGDPGEPCRNRAGYKTDHVGSGRCYLHGGAKGSGRPPIHGLYSSKRDDLTLAEEAERLRTDPDLLEMRDSAAVLKAVLNRQVQYHDERVEAFYEEAVDWALRYAADPETAGEQPKEPAPGEHVSLDVIRQLTVVQKATHDILYQKNNSLPLIEVQRVLAEVADHFQQISKEFGFPEEAVMKFRDKVRTVKLKAG